MGDKSAVIGSPEFHVERMKGLGASDVGAVLGVNPWRSAVDVWLEKTGRKPPFEGNAATYWGTKLEDLVAAEYCSQTGAKVARCNYTLRRGILLGHVDRLVVPEGGRAAVKADVRASRVVECKTAASDYGWDDGIPAHYEAQGFSYMALCPTVEVVDFAVLFLGTRKFDVVPLERDEAVISTILERCEEWWKAHVATDIAPDPVSEADCKALWGRHQAQKAVFATADVEVALSNLLSIREQKKALEEQEAKDRTIVMSLMQDAELLKSPDGAKLLATWKNAKDSAKVDWEAVARALGEGIPDKFDLFLKQFTSVKPGSRRFLLKD